MREIADDERIGRALALNGVDQKFMKETLVDVCDRHGRWIKVKRNMPYYKIIREFSPRDYENASYCDIKEVVRYFTTWAKFSDTLDKVMPKYIDNDGIDDEKELRDIMAYNGIINEIYNTILKKDDEPNISTEDNINDYIDTIKSVDDH